MSHDITANWDALATSATIQAGQYLSAAISSIDGALGDGYARAHPDLIAAVLRATSDDMRDAAIKLAAQDIRDAIRDLADAVRRDG